MQNLTLKNRDLKVGNQKLGQRLGFEEHLKRGNVVEMYRERMIRFENRSFKVQPTVVEVLTLGMNKEQELEECRYLKRL